MPPTQTSAFRFRRLLLACLPTVLLVGCGGGPEGANIPELFEVDGTVTKDGEPVPDLYIEFRGHSAPRYSQAVTDENGYYRMSYANDIFGVPAGTADIHISDLGAEIGRADEMDKRGRVTTPESTGDRVPKK